MHGFDLSHLTTSTVDPTIGFAQSLKWQKLTGTSTYYTNETKVMIYRYNKI